MEGLHKFLGLDKLWDLGWDMVLEDVDSVEGLNWALWVLLDSRTGASGAAGESSKLLYNEV